MKRALVPLAVLLACAAPRAHAQALSLRELYSLAESNADSLRMRSLGVQKALHALREARSRSLPRLTLEASGSYLASPPEGITVGAGELGMVGPLPIPAEDLVFVPDAEHGYLSFGAVLAQPLFTWGRLSSGVRSAELELSASQAERERQRLDLRQEVHRAYFGARLALESLPLLERLGEALALVAADRLRAADQGLATRLPFLEAQAELAVLRRRQSESRESLTTALRTLWLLCGLEPGQSLLDAPFRQRLPELDEELLARRAVAGSRELEIVDLRRRQALERVRRERGGGVLRPDLSLQLALEVNGQEVPWSSPSWTETWDWDLRLSVATGVKLFDGGEAGGRLEQVLAEAEAAGAACAQAEKLQRLRVRQAVQEARLAELELREREARLAAAEERRRNALSAFESELLSRADSQAALTGSLTAELERLAACYRLELALSALERLAGPIFPGSGS